MTFASCAVVLAEVFGSFVGAVLYELYGQRAVFWFLGLVSFMIQGYLVAILYIIRPTDEASPSPPSRLRSPRPSSLQPADVADGTPGWHFGEYGEMASSWKKSLTPQPGAMARMKLLMQSRDFACANLLIAMAAVIKGSVEEMLPFHGDHQWGYDPLEIGQLFCTVAMAYMLAAAFVNQFWIKIGRMQIGMSSCWLCMLGVSAWLAFAVVNYYKDPKLLTINLAMYGFCAGLTFTAAAQLIADVIDHEEGPFKDAANGIWNCVWEAGGSLGFFLGGYLAHHYDDQLELLTRYVIGAVATAMCMLAVNFWPEAATPSGKGSRKLDYGTAA
jgi:MFS family permease